MIGRSAPLQRHTALRATSGLRRTTALRSGGAGLKRSAMRRSAPAARTVPRDLDTSVSALVRLPAASTRRGTYSGSSHDPRPKTKARRNRRALNLARQEPCLLMVPLVCNRDKATTVSCHSNWGDHEAPQPAHGVSNVAQSASWRGPGGSHARLSTELFAIFGESLAGWPTSATC